MTRVTPPTLPTGFSDEDFGLILDAVMETARGRWFLTEYARRNRSSDTTLVLDAVGRLESAIAGASGRTESDRIRMDLREMAAAIARTKAEIAAIKPDGEDGRFEEASVELDAIVKATETATGDILGAAEIVQEIAWNLREMGVEAEVCDLIDTKAADIYTACSFQDITGQRIRKVIGVLRFLEERIETMMTIWEASGSAATPSPDPSAAGQRRGEPSLLNGPARPGEGLVQGDVDQMIADMDADGLIDTARPATPAPVAQTVLPPAAAPTRLSAPVAAMGYDLAASTVDVVTTAPALPVVWPTGAPTIEDLEKLPFVEKVAVMG